MASAMRAIMVKQNKSLTDFSEELGISRTALYDYLRAKGNPSAATIEHISEKLGVHPISLLVGLEDNDNLGIILLLLEMIPSIAVLPEKKRLHFAELFLEMVQLWVGDAE